MNKKNKIKELFIFWMSANALICLNFGLMTSMTEDLKLYRFPLLSILAGIVLIAKRERLNLKYIKCNDKTDVAYGVTSIIICITNAMFFYLYVGENKILKEIASQLNIDVRHEIFALTVIVAIASYPIVFLGVKYLCKECLLINRDTIEQYSYMKKTIGIVSSVYCLAIITIIRANYIYKDDMQRIVCGGTYYQRENRFLGEFVTGLLETDKFFSDISPITQILELVLMAISAVIVFTVITGKKNFKIIDYCAMTTFGISPYFLECISFKYDPPQHGFAVLMAVLPLMYINADRKKYMIITTICTVALCCFHQVPMAVFPTIIIIICLLKWNRKEQSNKEIGRFLRDSAIGYIVGGLIFKFLFMHEISYIAESSRILPADRLVSGIFQNYKTFFTYMLCDFNWKWIIAIVIIIFFAWLYLVMSSSQNKIKSLLINTLGILVTIALSNSIYPILSEPLHSPRHMYSIGITIGIFVILAVSVFEYKAVIAKATTIFLTLSFFMFSIKYGNLLSYQADYTSFRTEQVINELSEMDVYKENDLVLTQIIGETGFSPTVSVMSDDIDDINLDEISSLMGKIKTMLLANTLPQRLVTTSFNEYFASWQASDIYALYGLNTRYYTGEDVDLTGLGLPVYKDNYYYTIYAKGDKVLVKLKEREGVAWLNQ